MYFKSMEIQGFKSFPDKTELNFDRKMTAIVGSNGNGKSNISDALRWVMGEQGAKTLRGDKMEDVIFHGTVSRRPMGFAKVSLMIDNTDRALDVDSDEVTIARKLYRTGDSEYLINGAKCRLKDIQELLMGTGLGRDGYSIIGQGRVSEIINSKVNQRRELFEEAAGVSKFLHKKQESERDLARANDNITRLKDIESELASRLPALERKSEKAKQARVLDEQKTSLDIGVSVWDMERIDRELIQIDDRILKNQGECEHFERELNELDQENEEIASRKMMISAKQEELRKKGDNAKGELAAADKAKAILENDIVHCNEQIEQLKQQIRDSEKGAEELDKKISDLQNEIDEKEKQLEINETEVKRLGSELSEMSGESDRLDREYKELDKKHGALLTRRTELLLTMENAQQNIAKLQEQSDASKEHFENREELLKGYRARKKELEQRLEQAQESKSEAENKLSGYSRLFEGRKAKLDQQEIQFEQIRSEYEKARSDLKALSDVEKNMAMYMPSVKSVINATRHGKISGIEGTVADVIKMDKRYTVAIEIALGAALQNIIVNNEETAKRCIRYLKETGGGRATFLPLTSIKGGKLNVRGLDNEYGFEGIASDLVKCADKYQNIIQSLLGRCAIVEDIDTATVIAKKNDYSFRIVTLDGQVINRGGSFTGGSLKESSGIIARKQDIETLQMKTAQLSQKKEALDGELFTMREEVKKLSIEMEGYKEQLTNANTEEKAVLAEISGVREMIASVEEQQDSEETLLERSKADIARLEKTVADSNTQLEQCEREIAELAKTIEQADIGIQQRLAENNRLGERITELGMKKLALEKDIEHISSQKNAAEESKMSLYEGGNILQNKIIEEQEKIRSFEQEIVEKQELAKKLQESFEVDESEGLALIKEINSLEQRVNEINREIRVKSDDKEKFSNALAVEKERKAASEKESERIKANLWELYELSPTEAQAKAQIPQDIQAAKAQLAELKQKISRLGPVDYADIDEYLEVSRRHDEMKKQLDDMENSKKELEKLIERLTADIRERFLSSFNDINEHFRRIFTEVFGGGSAHLELTDPNDVLNSGIEIFAAPPGKLIKNLIALSGGEQAMVAITIYFAILLHRPTPFCMLDEVDAALDEVNVVKYITYLKRFSGSTQLMAITHRRGTIEGCDVLYGVFMQEKGVSRLLRQELTDELAAELD